MESHVKTFDTIDGERLTVRYSDKNLKVEELCNVSQELIDENKAAADAFITSHLLESPSNPIV